MRAYSWHARVAGFISETIRISGVGTKTANEKKEM